MFSVNSNYFYNPHHLYRQPVGYPNLAWQLENNLLHINTWYGNILFYIIRYNMT